MNRLASLSNFYLEKHVTDKTDLILFEVYCLDNSCAGRGNLGHQLVGEDLDQVVKLQNEKKS